MTLLSRQVAGLLLAAAGLVLATSASVLLVQPILAPQPDTQAAPPPVPDAQRPDDADGPDGVTFLDIPHRPSGTPSTAQTDPEPVEVPDIPSVTTVAAASGEVVGAEDTPSGETPAEAAPHQRRPSAPDPRATNRRDGQLDIASRPDRGRPAFPSGWPWHERLSNQGNGKGFGPPAGPR